MENTLVFTYENLLLEVNTKTHSGLTWVNLTLEKENDFKMSTHPQDTDQLLLICIISL